MLFFKLEQPCFREERARLMPPLAFALPSLVAVLVAGPLLSEAGLFQLEEENLRLRAQLEQETNTLNVILDSVEVCSGGTCSEPRKSPPRPVSPRSPRRRLSHTAGQTNCLPAATPSLGAGAGWEAPKGANAFAYIDPDSDSSTGVVDAGPGGSGSYYQTTSEMSRTVLFTKGLYAWEVSWELVCDGVSAGNGNSDSSGTVISSSGVCTLTMKDTFGDGWNGGEWSIPGLGLGPFSMPNDFEAQVSFEVTPGFALGFDGAPCNGAGVATVAFQYHMFDDGALSLKSAEGATLWTKTGQQSSSADHKGWIQSEAVPVSSASFRFVYVPPESSSSPPLPTAAIAQMAVCCSAPAAASTTFVHHSVPHSFVDAGACLHTEGPPLTIREDATSTVSATRTPPPDSNHRVCCLTRLRRALWQPGLPSLAGATRTWSRCLCRCACKSPIAQTAMSPRSRSAWMPPSRTSSPCRAG